MKQLNKIIAYLMLLFLLVHTTPFVVSADNSTSITHITTQNLCTEPSTRASVVNITPTDEYLSITGTKDEHFPNRGDLIDGFMHRAYLTALTARNPENGCGIIKGSEVTLHSGPGLAFKVTGHVQEGAKACIVDYNNQWFKVMYGGQVNYIAAEHLQLKDFPFDIFSTKETTPPAAKKSKKETTVSRKNASKQVSKKASYDEDHKQVVSNGETSPVTAKIVSDAKKYLGIPYVWGGTSPKGFDCSGFTQYIFSKNGIQIPRTTTDQYTQGTPVKKSNLQPGDLVFLANTYRDGISHVGIYIGNGNVIHSSSSKGITITSLSGSFFSEHYYGSRRIVK